MLPSLVLAFLAFAVTTTAAPATAEAGEYRCRIVDYVCLPWLGCIPIVVCEPVIEEGV